MVYPADTTTGADPTEPILRICPATSPPYNFGRSIAELEAEVALLREGVQRAEKRELEACAEADRIREALKRVERRMVLLGASRWLSPRFGRSDAKPLPGPAPSRRLTLFP